MIGYNSPPAALNYGTVNYFIRSSSQTGGTNAVTFDDSSFAVGVDLYKIKIDEGFNCCPINFIVFNDAINDYNSCRFFTSQDLNSNVDFEAGRYTILYPLDKPKVNHSHVDSLATYLNLTFTPGGSLGDLNIIVNFTFFK
jgi:hypothetical protein